MSSTRALTICATCGKGGGIAMCNGCRKSFCTKHFTEHRQELSLLIDEIGQEHNLLRRDMHSDKVLDPLLIRIDEWEHESIKTIQTHANNARIALRQLHEKRVRDLTASVDRLTEELNTCRESNDYTEIDINNWNRQLESIREMIERSSAITIDVDSNEASIVRLIKVNYVSNSMVSFTENSRSIVNRSGLDERCTGAFAEMFGETFGRITLSADSLSAFCLANRWDGSCVTGIGRYSSQVHCIRLKVERKISNYWFIGIITESQEPVRSISDVKSAYGWWELGYSITNGKVNEKNQSKNIITGDEIDLILKCDERLIQFVCHRTGGLVGIPVNLEHCPFPWKLVVRLDSENDCVRIIPS